MALSAHSIPVIVGNGIEESLKKNLVYRLAFNERWSGELAYGSALKIPSVGAVNTGAYTRYEDINWQDATDASTTLTIDQQRYFAIQLDDLDQAQARPDIMAGYASEAVYSLQDDIDGFLAGVLAAAANIDTNLGSTGTPLSVNSDNAFETLLEAARQMDDAKVSRAGRYAIIPPWFLQKLVLGNVNLSTNNTAELSNGIVGSVAGFNLAVSHNVPAVGTGDDEYQIICGVDRSATMALQLQRVQQIELPNTFATGLRGVALYGATATQPDAIAIITASEAAEA